MAGTMFFEVRPQHVFQRKFDSADLSEALKTSFWYMISRRPRVRIDVSTLEVEKNVLAFSISTSESATTTGKPIPMRIDATHLGDVSQFRTHSDGSYFSFRCSSRGLIHGDAWALASFAAKAAPYFSRQEIMYIGQSFGSGGSSNAWKRTTSHKKLQQIYADHAGEQWDIFVAPLALQRSSIESWDRFDDLADGPDITRFYGEFIGLDKSVKKPVVDLIEHSLISYFKPPYNELLTVWDPLKPTGAMRLMRDSIRARVLNVLLDGWEGLARFYSAAHPEDSRSHFIERSLPTERKPADPLPDYALSWMESFNEMRDRSVAFTQELAELSGVHLVVFGETAPDVRVPPEVRLPTVDSASGTETSTAEGWTPDVDDVDPLSARERQELERPFPLSTIPTYTWDGHIKLRETLHASWQDWTLHSDNCATIRHGLVVSEDQDTASAFIQSVAYEAVRSQVFRVVPILLGRSPTLQPDFSAFRGALGPAVRSLPGAKQLLSKMLLAAPPRSRRRITRSNPANLLVIDGADPLVHDPTTAELLHSLLTLPPESRVAIQLAINDLRTLEAKSPLVRELLGFENVALCLIEGGFSTLAELQTRQEDPLQSSYEAEKYTFAVFTGPLGAGVGQVVASRPASNRGDKVRAWATKVIEANGEVLIGWDKESSTMWRTLDAFSVRMWCLRRHVDRWVLIQEYKRYSGPTGGSVGEAIEWANSTLEGILRVRPLPNWKPGPGLTGGGDSVHYLVLESEPRLDGEMAGVALWSYSGNRLTRKG